MIQPTNYILECNNFMIEDLHRSHDDMMDVMESEYEFILNCIENNYISMEAAEETEKKDKKESLFTRIIRAIRDFLNKFLEKARTIVTSLDDFIKNSLPLLDDMDFSGLKMKAMPYWYTSNKEITDTIDKMINQFKSIKDEEGKEYPANKDAIVQTVNEFKLFNDPKVGYTQACKLRFSFGMKKSISDLQKIQNSEGVEYSDAATIKNICTDMSNYLKSYDEFSKKLKSEADNFTTELKKAENDYKRSLVKESSIYLNLEEAYIGDTDLRFCRNYHSLFEADANPAPATPKPAENKNEEQGKNTVVSTEEPKAEEKKEEPSKNTGYNRYKMDTAQLILNTITAAAFIAETKVSVYRKLITGILSAKKADKTEKDTNKVESEKAEEKKETEDDKKKEKKGFFGKNKK